MDRDPSLWFPGAGSLSGHASITLFCLPHAGAGLGAFHGWQDFLSPHIAMVPVQYPGRDRRSAEPVETSIKKLAERLVRPVLERTGGQPYAIFGHSMGAVVGYELAVRLTVLQAPPEHLLVSGQAAPHVCRPGGVHDMPDAELVAHLAALQGTAPDVLANSSLLEVLLPIIRGDFQACETYEFGDAVSGDPPMLATDITVLSGTDDPTVPVGELGRWGDLSTGRLDVQVSPGGHFFLFDQLPSVLGTINTVLTRPESRRNELPTTRRFGGNLRCSSAARRGPVAAPVRRAFHPAHGGGPVDRDRGLGPGHRFR
jgi:surfactin synthase thioesterase subunit